MKHWLLAAAWLALAAAPISAADVIAPASERFASGGAGDAPDFQQHIVPLLGRLGCNGRACHGSFQGRGGFRLSLFGYDFTMDHTGLTKGKGDEGVTRVNLQSPRQSLILQKPTLDVDHEGGERFTHDSWQYRLLERWVESGARNVTVEKRLERLEAYPPEIVFARPGESVALRLVAVWADGSREDVTCLCRFQANDDSVAEVDADGVVKAMSKGDTHIVAFYDNGVAAIPVLMPMTDRAGSDYPAVASPTKVDEMVISKLRKLGVVPSDMCSDVEFLRRISLDITATLPTPAEVEAFIADRSADKRARKIEQLLDSPAYAAWWANKLCDFTGNNPFRQGEGAVGQRLAVQWYEWVKRRLAENTPYDELIANMVTASGRLPGQSYEEYCDEMSAYFREKNRADFTERPSMPYYWSRSNLKMPEDRALAFAHSFLGVRLQCAQCHKHPYDQWTQGDFKQFTSLFAGVNFGIAPESQDAFRRTAQAVGAPTSGNQAGQVSKELISLAEQGKTIPFREVFVAKGGAGSANRLTILGTQQPNTSPDGDPRKAIMDWMRSKNNPYFARAFVNRVWATYFHAGIIDPVDDLSQANPPSNGELLDYLAGGFVDSGYDMKWLHREIANSLAYQRSWKPNDTNAQDTRNFSRAVPRRIPAEVVYDGITQVTAADAQQEHVRQDLTRRAIGHLSMLMSGTYAMRVFGKPDRSIECDCERTSDPTLLQSIFFQNDPIVHQRLSGSGWLQEIGEREKAGAVSSQTAKTQLVRQAYLRTVSRPPTLEESERALEYLADSDSTTSGLSDLLWALVNSKEFILNH
jgi:hypothetical protein